MLLLNGSIIISFPRSWVHVCPLLPVSALQRQDDLLDSWCLVLVRSDLFLFSLLNRCCCCFCFCYCSYIVCVMCVGESSCHCAGPEGWRRLRRVSSLLPSPWTLGVKLRSSNLHGKHFACRVILLALAVSVVSWLYWGTRMEAPGRCVSKTICWPFLSWARFPLLGCGILLEKPLPAKDRWTDTKW